VGQIEAASSGLKKLTRTFFPLSGARVPAVCRLRTHRAHHYFRAYFIIIGEGLGKRTAAYAYPALEPNAFCSLI
jgi:hypothetical protein